MVKQKPKVKSYRETQKYLTCRRTLDASKGKLKDLLQTLLITEQENKQTNVLKLIKCRILFDNLWQVIQKTSEQRNEGANIEKLKVQLIIL